MYVIIVLIILVVLWNNEQRTCYWTSHFVFCREVVHSSEIQNVLVIMENEYRIAPFLIFVKSIFGLIREIIIQP